MVKERIGIKELGQLVAQEIEKRIPEARVEVREVIKNNSLILQGITIIDKQESNGITPTIYIDNYYEEYCDSKLTVEEIAEKVIELHYERKDDVPFDIKALTDFDNAKKNLRIKLINTEKNRKLLETVPHKAFLDMSMVYQVKAFSEDDAVGTTVVSNSLLKMYGVSADELHEAAFETMKESEPVDIVGMTRKIMGLASMMGMDEMELEEIVSRLEDEQMILISNTSNICGASQILYKENLQKIADIFKEDFYILPSSIHECLAVRTSDSDIEMLKAMVTEVNSTQVLPEEVLSDNVYFYSTETGELAIA